MSLLFYIFLHQGTPSPDTEQKAVDAVMQYAIHKLGFQPKNIALFAWSIGGYSAAWAAKTYPDVKFVVRIFSDKINYFLLQFINFENFFF